MMLPSNNASTGCMAYVENGDGTVSVNGTPYRGRYRLNQAIYTQYCEPNTVIISNGFATMGIGLPGADFDLHVPDWEGDPDPLALEYAERMTYTGRKVDVALFERLKAHFSEPQIVELTAAIALENFRSKFNPALGVESQGFCLLPGR